MDARRVGLSLAILGVLLLSASHSLDPSPGSFEQWACCGVDPHSQVLAARGPVVARYDEALDVTFVVFGCAHGYCPFAVKIAGDVRDDVQGSGTTLLLAKYRPNPGGTEPMPEPIKTPEGLERARSVTNATSNTLKITSVWAHLGPRLGAFVLAAVGVTIAWGCGRAELVASGAGALAGLFAARSFAARPDLLVGPMLLLLVAGLSVAAAIAARFWPKARPIAHGFIMLTAGLGYGLITMDAYAAPHPTM